MLNINALPSYIMLDNQRGFGHTIQFGLTAWVNEVAKIWNGTKWVNTQ